MKKTKPIVPRGSKEYKELMAARKQMLKAIEMLERAKEQMQAQHPKEEEPKDVPIIQKDQ